MKRALLLIGLLTGCSSTAPEPTVAPTEAHEAERDHAPAPGPGLTEANEKPEPHDPPRPPGFPPLDEFADAATACEELVPRLVAREDLRPPILAWCRARAWASSRNGKVRSRLDGSWIHDRDRPSGYAFYRSGLHTGTLDPETCEHHVVDVSLTRDRDAREFPNRWPYTTHCDFSQGACNPGSPGHMLEDRAKAWHKHPPDYERFGTRGPIDNNLRVATKYLGGCFPPEALDRYDVSVAVTIERSEDLCQRLEDRLDTRAERQAAKASRLPTRCRSASDLRVIWHPKFWYSVLPEALG